jgi:hypothetical protein
LFVSVITTILVAVGLTFASIDQGRKKNENILEEIVFAFVILVLAYTGSRILGRWRTYPRSLGWLFSTAAAGAALVFSTDYATFAFLRHLPGAAWVAWIGDVIFWPGVAIIMPLFLLRLPAGEVDREDPERRTSSRTRRVSVLAAVVLALAKSVEVQLYSYHGWNGHGQAPLASLLSKAIPIASNRLIQWVSKAGLVAGFAFLILAILLGVWRLTQRAKRARRENSDEIRQLRWYKYSGLLILVAVVPVGIFAAESPVVGLLGAVSVLSIPMAFHKALNTGEDAHLARLVIVLILSVINGLGHHYAVEKVGSVLDVTNVASAVLVQSPFHAIEERLDRLVDREPHADGKVVDAKPAFREQDSEAYVKQNGSVPSEIPSEILFVLEPSADGGGGDLASVILVGITSVVVAWIVVGRLGKHRRVGPQRRKLASRWLEIKIDLQLVRGRR